MNEEWDQQRAVSRSIETMRQIALDALQFYDEDEAYYTYARKHRLTVNELVYYLNAYEYGGDEGLQAIRAPDIIPPSVARSAVKTIDKMLGAHFEEWMRYRITDEGVAIGIYQIQQRHMTGEEYLFAICQFRWTRATNHWHLYWMRKFDAWWPYSPPERGRKFTLRARMQQVLDDEWGCFWV